MSGEEAVQGDGRKGDLLRVRLASATDYLLAKYRPSPLYELIAYLVDRMADYVAYYESKREEEDEC